MGQYEILCWNRTHKHCSPIGKLRVKWVCAEGRGFFFSLMMCKSPKMIVNCKRFPE